MNYNWKWLGNKRLHVMPPSFPRDERNSTLLSEGPPHEVSQLGYGGGRGSSTGTSCWDHGGGGGVGRRDGLAVQYGSSIQAQRVDQGASSLLRTELILGSHRVYNL